MFEKIIAYSLKNKLLVLLGVFALALGGIYSMTNIAVDAVPDITNNQVQIVTSAPTLASEEVEKYITLPIEMAVSNIPDVIEIRSISRYGLSVITIVFKDKVDLMLARQFVGEQLTIVKNEIPPSFGTPEMMPITTGLGEIYQYVLRAKPGYEEKFSLMEIRTIQDWIVKRQLSGLPGIIEVSSFGGFVKQYEVGVIPEKLLAHDLSILDIEDALTKNNNNSGGSYIETINNAFYIKTEGRAESIIDIENIVVKNEGTPVKIKDVATIGYGSPKRYGAMTMDGKGEVVGGITLMYKGANSYSTNKLVKERVKEIEKNLPEGIEIYPYIDRSVLVGKTIQTVSKNLIEGGLIVIFVLVVLLGNFRAGLIVSSVIPLSMLFAFILMKAMGVSANLMSLGAIDFGIVVDGAVIIVEGILHSLHIGFKGQTLSKNQFNDEIKKSTSQIYRSAAFGVLIILIVFFPIFALEGIEGKTFIPMAQTVSFALIGSLILSVTYVPVASAIFLNKKINAKPTISDKIIHFIEKLYRPVLNQALVHPKTILIAILAIFIGSIVLLSKLGSEFIPTLEEGDLAMQMSLPPGSSLKSSIANASKAEQILLENFEEVNHVVSKIGTAEVPTDPMAIEDADIMILLKEKDEWKNASTRQELIEKMKEKLAAIPNVSFEFSQPIQLRFNELMTGAKTDISIQIFGEDHALLKKLADNLASEIAPVKSIGDIKVEQTEGLKQLNIVIDRNALAIHGLNIDQVNSSVEAAYGGAKTGVIYENERFFDLTVRLNKNDIENISLQKIFIRNEAGNLVSLAQVAKIEEKLSPMQISREEAKRRITVGVNVRDRDVASLVKDIKQIVESKIEMPAGYTIKYGGQFENLENALARLKIVVPIALLLILLLLYFAFGSVKESLIIFMAVPFASIGGILALWLRDLPFSISAGIGFIALFGVAVLNGIVLINEIVQQKLLNTNLSIEKIVYNSALSRLRPVLITALVASLGFLPMALANSSGAEVQRPLATVVIGGLITSTLLTLLVLPTLYLMVSKGFKLNKSALVAFIAFIPFSLTKAQNIPYDLNDLLQSARDNNVAFKLNELEKRKWENEYKNPFQLQATQIQLQYGQNDGLNNDAFLSILQDLGSPWIIKRRRNLSSAGVELTNLKENLLENEIDYTVKSLYYEWLFYHNINDLVKSIGTTITESEAIMKLKLEVGDVSFSEYLLLKQLINSINQKSQNYFSMKTAKEQDLANISGLKGSIKDTTLHTLAFEMNNNLSNRFLNESEALLQKNEHELNVIKSNYHPSLQAGYFHQSLDRVNGYQGALIGISVPIILSGRKYEIQKQSINNEYSKIQNENQLMFLQNELDAVLQNIVFIEKELVFNSSVKLTETTTALSLLDKQKQEGYINTLDYVRNADILIEGAINQLQLINSYNQLILKYNFLTSENQ